jgi:hypothetical protein
VISMTCGRSRALSEVRKRIRCRKKKDKSLQARPSVFFRAGVVIEASESLVCCHNDALFRNKISNWRSCKDVVA